MVPLCSVRLIPHPDSDPAGAAHHRSWKFAAWACGIDPPNTHTGGVPNSSRVNALVCVTVPTVYANCASVASVKVSVPDPTAVRVTLAGSNGTASNAGPWVWYSVPA